jgi:hypothetical protein
MGRIDDGVDALGRKIGGQALGAAEAADAARDQGGRWIGGRAGERQERRNAGFVDETARKRARFRRAAENEKAEALQGTAP